MDDSQWESLQNEITEALSTTLAKHDSGFVTKWVAVVEAFHAESGERWFWSIGAKSNNSWDAKGLLKHAMDIEQADTIRNRIRDDD